ncbi:glycosyltransferase [Rhizobium sp. SL86]|uniref:glycosyltransferase n=1 Tax=Rhizobium sp. SL86 TaxID=2995148 RepID=UPI00227453DA|nr:glycosyltransferase [Rhizobium sp. SL86]MCY1669400.1 glycosyltransferase [Rhizobium sp. SL86]
MIKVSIINAACRARDAIGEAVHETCRAIEHHGNYEYQLYTFYSDAPDVNTCVVNGASEILSDHFFLETDIVLIHFGFYTPLLNVLLGGTKDMVRIVRYHNITPKEFVDPSIHHLIAASREQLTLLDEADEIWADSPFNRDDLLHAGITKPRISVSPLFVKSAIRAGRISDKTGDDIINILYVGRFVKSKGVIDLIEAIYRMPNRSKIQIRLVGATAYSDAGYIQYLKQKIAEYELQDVCTFVGEASDADLANFYADSHLMVIPSYHEGFCVPLAEALIGGLFPIAYASGNIPNIIAGVGALEPPGDIAALSKTIARMVDWFREKRSISTSAVYVNGEKITLQDYQLRVNTHVNQYDLKNFHRRIDDGIKTAVNRACNKHATL